MERASTSFFFSHYGKLKYIMIQNNFSSSKIILRSGEIILESEDLFKELINDNREDKPYRSSLSCNYSII